MFIFPKCIFSKLEQPLNINDIVLTLEVSKFDISIEVNLDKPLNNAYIFSTEEVFIFPNFIFSKSLQSQNILHIVLTLEESKFDKSISVILDKVSNIDSSDSICFSNLRVILFLFLSKSHVFLHESFLIPFTYTSDGSELK